MSVLVREYPSSKDYDKYKDLSKEFVMTASDGKMAHLITYGALIEKLLIPDNNGDVADVILGMKDLDLYMNNGASHGSIVGRCANRIANASFVLDGVTYSLPKNDGDNNIHSGPVCFHNVFWNGDVISKADVEALIGESGIAGIPAVDGDGVIFTYTSPDGTSGFPGNLETTVVYVWLTDGTLFILYVGKTDKATVFAPTNHGYFNLGGHNSGALHEAIVTVNADKVTHKANNNCPDGEYIDVDGTIFDFRDGRALKQVLVLDNDQTKNALGVDQNFCINGADDSYKFASRMEDCRSSRVMEVYTDMPGVQLYAGNHLGGDDQKGDIPYAPYGALCMEAQMYPNAVNIDSFPSAILRPGEVGYHCCGYRFFNK